MMRGSLIALCCAALLFIALVAVRALHHGVESGPLQAAQIAAAFVAALAGAAVLRGRDAVTRASIVLGWALVSAGLFLYEAALGPNAPAALPLATAGFCLLVAGAATAGIKLVAGIPREQR